MDAGAGQADGWGPGAGGAGKEGGSAGCGQGRVASCKPWMLSGGSPRAFPAHPPVDMPWWAPGVGVGHRPQAAGPRFPTISWGTCQRPPKGHSKIARNRGPAGPGAGWAHVRH